MAKGKAGRPKKALDYFKEPEPVLDPQIEIRKTIINRCYKDLDFLDRTLSPKTYYLPSPEIHKEWDELLLDPNITQLLIEAPRGTAKSTKVKAKIKHHVIFDDGDKFVIVQSKTRPEAINRLTSIKNMFEYSKEFRDLFGYCGKEVAEVWREDKITTVIGGRRVTIKAIGTGQQTRGGLEEDTRITLYILDDPDDEDNTKTKESMDANFDKFLGGVAGLDRRNGRVIVIGTPVRQGCIVDRLKDASRGWTVRSYKAFDPDTKDTLWGEMYPYSWLMDKKREFEELGKLSKFYSEYMCEIVGEEDQLFKKEYIQYYKGIVEHKNGEAFLKIGEINGVEMEESRPVNIFLGIDPASSTKQTADYSVTMPIAYDGENIFVLPYFRKRVTPTAHAEQIIDLIKALSPKRGHVESVGYQEMLRQYLRQRLEEEGIYLPGLETKFNPRTEKSTRLETLHPFFYNRRVYFLEDMQNFIDELLMYPRGKHDDTIDGFYYATRKLINPHHTAEEQELSDDIKVILQRNRKPKPLGYLAV